MNLGDLSASQISCMALAIVDILAKNATLADLEILQHLLSLMRDNISLRIHIIRLEERNSEKSAEKSKNN